jgi:N-acetyl-gamma-glutamyl-phosphate reductase
MKKQVGVFGATGYSGKELVRLLAGHPALEVAFATGTGNGHLKHDEGLSQRADAFLLALPHGIAGVYASRLRGDFPGSTIVDLSGDLRLPDATAYREWYGEEPPAPSLLGRACYGLTEIYRERLVGARLIANPGCYATSVLLPLIPLLRERLVLAEDVVVDAKSGASGAGRALREDLLFCELAGDLSPYSPGRTHRHVGEIEAVLAESTDQRLTLTFCPHLLPVKRGILSAIYVRTNHDVETLRASLARAYEGSPFVHVLNGAPPRLSDVEHTNDCLISLHAAAPGRVVIFSALDNLVKGAAGQAIQNLNLALGLAETAGLPQDGSRRQDGSRA